MKSNKVFCDHCGKELNEMKDYIDLSIDLNHIWRTHDLCADCLEKLKDIIDEFCDHPTEKGGEQE